MRLITNLACGVALVVLTGCDSVTGPEPLDFTVAQPAPPPVAPRPGPAPDPPWPIFPWPQTSPVRLELVNLRVTDGGRVRFVVKNLGPTGASVEFVRVETAGFDPEYYGEGCGGWRTIHVDTLAESEILEGDTLGRCTPSTTSEPDVEVGITVFFRDDTNQLGSASGMTRTPK